MKKSQLTPPWTTVVGSLVLALVLSFIVGIFTDSTVNKLIISFGLAISITVYGDYILPRWRARTLARVLAVVSTDENLTTESRVLEAGTSSLHTEVGSSQSSQQGLHTFKNSAFSTIAAVPLSDFQNFSTEKHRLDRLRRYRANLRKLVCVVLVTLVFIDAVVNYISTGFFHINLVGFIVTIFMLLEYNAHIVTQQPVTGLFFRDNSVPVTSVSSGLEGEQKMAILFNRNPFGIGVDV